MSENEMSQQERDAAVIARDREWHEHVTEYMRIQEWPSLEASFLPSETIVRYNEVGAHLRTIDRLTAENQRLRAACEGVPDYLDASAKRLLEHRPSHFDIEAAETMYLHAYALRAALASASDGVDNTNEEDLDAS